MAIYKLIFILTFMIISTHSLSLWEDKDSLRRALDVVHHRRKVLESNERSKKDEEIYTPAMAEKLERLLEELDDHLEEEEADERPHRVLDPSEFTQFPSMQRAHLQLNSPYPMEARKRYYQKKRSEKRQSFSRSMSKMNKKNTLPYGEWNSFGFMDQMGPPKKRQAALRKREEGNQKLMGELNEILKDDKNEKKHLKKRQNEESYEKVSDIKQTENETDASDPKRFYETVPLEDIGEKIEEFQPSINKENIPEWLKKEYIKTIAASLSTLKKKKRGSWQPLVVPQELKNTMSSESKIPEFSFEANKGGKGRFGQVVQKLNSIEDAMITEALDMIQKGAWEEGSGRESVLMKLAAAYDIDKIRESLEHLEMTMDQMEIQENQEFALPIEEKRERNLLAEDLTVMDTKRSRSDESSDDLPYETMPSKDGNMMFLSDNSIKIPLKMNDRHSCPALDLLTSDCAILGDIIPGGKVRDTVLQACNWHELCYSCGEAFGMSSDECDVGFIEQTQTICRDDEPCQSTAKLLLVPLRQRRVFYKRSVPDICYRNSCVGEFLRQGG